MSVADGQIHAGELTLVPRSATGLYIEGGFNLWVEVTAAADACSEFHTWVEKHCAMDRTWLDIEFGGLAPIGPPPGKVYPVTPQLERNETAIASLRRSPPATGCTAGLTEPFDKVRASSGSLRVDAFERYVRVAATYELTFETGESTSGSFDVPFCNAENLCDDDAH